MDSKLNTRLDRVVSFRNQEVPVCRHRDFFNDVPFHYKVVSPTRFVGVEFEIERWTDTCYKVIYATFGGEEQTVLRFTEDGSLRNNGLELVTKPLPALHAAKTAQLLYDNLPLGCDFSDRTSTHIHVNVRDLTFNQVKGAVAVYTVVERLLYTWIGESRRKGIFCVPLIECSLMSLFGTTDPIQSTGASWLKYTGLNLKPLFTYGTIEFRHLPGTRNIERFVDWLNMVLSIVRVGEEVPFEELIEKIYNLNTNSEYVEFLYWVFGNDLGMKLLASETWRKDMERSVSFLKIQFSNNTAAVKALRETFKTSSTLGKRMGYAQGTGVKLKPLVPSFDFDALQNNASVNIDPSTTTNLENAEASLPGVHHGQLAIWNEDPNFYLIGNSARLRIITLNGCAKVPQTETMPVNKLSLNDGSFIQHWTVSNITDTLFGFYKSTIDMVILVPTGQERYLSIELRTLRDFVRRKPGTPIPPEVRHLFANRVFLHEFDCQKDIIEFNVTQGA